MKHHLAYFITTVCLCLHSTCFAIPAYPPYPSLDEPKPILLSSCIKSAHRLPELEACRNEIRLQREELEEYNVQLKRYCDSIVNFDGVIRRHAIKGELSWEEYETIKDKISYSITECLPDTGSTYKVYRSRMREYRNLISAYSIQYDLIINGRVSLGDKK